MGIVVMTLGMSAAWLGVSAAPGHAQGSSMDCSVIDPTLTGVIVVTPSGRFNANCTMHQNAAGPGGPAGGGGAMLIPCAQIPDFGQGFQGNVVVSPSGNVNGNCHFHAG